MKLASDEEWQHGSCAWSCCTGAHCWCLSDAVSLRRPLASGRHKSESAELGPSWVHQQGTQLLRTHGILPSLLTLPTHNEWGLLLDIAGHDAPRRRPL